MDASGLYGANEGAGRKEGTADGEEHLFSGLHVWSAKKSSCGFSVAQALGPPYRPKQAFNGLDVKCFPQESHCPIHLDDSNFLQSKVFFVLHLSKFYCVGEEQ